MTNDNATGGTTLVNPAPTSGLKHSLRSATRATRATTRAEQERRLEATLIHEEDKVVEDEEVTSVEDNDDAAVEHTMLTVALVNSVVDGKVAHVAESDDKTGQESPVDDEAKRQRYGLRKRRRPTGLDLERLEHFQSSTEGGLARVAKRADVTPDTGPPKVAEQSPEAASESVRSEPDPTPRREPVETEAVVIATSDLPGLAPPVPTEPAAQPPETLPKLASPAAVLSPPVPRDTATLLQTDAVLPPPAPRDTAVPAEAVLPPPVERDTAEPTPVQTEAVLSPPTPRDTAVPSEAVLPSPVERHTAVPTPVEYVLPPLATRETTMPPPPKAVLPSPPSPLKAVLPSPTLGETATPAPVAPTSVPPITVPTKPVSTSNVTLPPPKPATAPLPPHKIEPNTETSSDSKSRPETASRLEAARPSSVPSSVPNPLAVLIELPQPEVIIPPPQEKATQEAQSTTVANPFAVPCPLPASCLSTEKADPSFLESAEKRKVTINEPEGRRSRGFSIDVDLNIDFDDSSASATHTSEKRDRAFSFECFAFGINADEPLPPLEPSASSSHVASLDDRFMNGRPRGDSIIFDPSSFQDGGIHEKHALESRRSDSVGLPEGSETTRAMPAAAPVPVSAPSSTLGVPVPNPTFSISAESSEIVTSVTTAAGTTTTVNMHLVNKDGRIGIYLPEARRARIARFHSKRAQRIWKKRIKYDCRKKLADSRPRIKGRFVKRSDMDED